MRILLFGAGGLLGRSLRHGLSGHELTALTHAQADITNAARLDELFRTPWDAVINAAAICDFDACESDEAATGKINRDAPLDLARRCHGSGALFVQFSSDYVFRGDENRPLSENDAPHPLSAYGRQKADLDRQIPTLCPRHLLLRLSWLYGPGGKTFMSHLPALLMEQDTLRIASGKRGRCLYTHDAAHWIARLITTGQTGLFHLANDGDTSWEEFARVCLEKMRTLNVNPRCQQIHEIPYEDLGPNWSKRPRWSCLDTSKLRAASPPGPRPWGEALTDFLREPPAPDHSPDRAKGL